MQTTTEVKKDGTGLIVREETDLWRSKIAGGWSPASATATVIAPGAVGALIGYVLIGGKGGALAGAFGGIIANALLWRAVFDNISKNQHIMFPV